MALGPSSRSAPPSVARLRLGISISLLFTKSERFKAIRGIALVPSLFNISEPPMFGLPVVLNPTYFIPFVLNIPVCAIVVQALYALGLGAAFNPTIQLPGCFPSRSSHSCRAASGAW